MFILHLYYYRFASESVNEPNFDYKCKVPELCIEEQNKKIQLNGNISPSPSENEKKTP